MKLLSVIAGLGMFVLLGVLRVAEAVMAPRRPDPDAYEIDDWEATL